jgi:ribonuclease E
MPDPITGSAGGDAPDNGTSSPANSGAPRRRRRGSRGGRNRRRAGQAAARPQPDEPGTEAELAEPAEPADTAESEGLPEDLPDRGDRLVVGRRDSSSVEVSAQPPPRRPKIGDSRPGPLIVPKLPPPGQGAPRPEEDGAAKGTKRRRRRGRGRGPAERAGELEGTDELEEVFERRRGRERKGRPVGRYLMCVHVRESAIQLAVLEGLSLIEHYVSRPQDDANQIDGNVYLGRVQNVLPGMEAAFVDIGTPKNAVLYRGDVQYDPDDVIAGDGERPARAQARIEHLLRPGQTIVCQVTKNPIGTKGGRLTQEVSLPGRFLVFIPNSDTYGISKRLPEDERKRLRRVLDEVRPPGHGLIVRTAAEGASTEELRRDVERLLEQWRKIDEAAQKATTPALLYQEPGMAVRIIREEFNSDYRGVVIDDPALYEEVRQYVASITPELEDRVEYYDTSEDPLPIFERFHVHEQLHKALDRKVWLPSGGSIIIERTEALTVIDVNTGKNVGRSSLEETVFRNNLEAAEEIARQLRLRDIGGIIVIDFIDMETERNREEVMVAFRDALARDKTRAQVFDMSPLGLVEMTRKRVSEGLVESFSSTCPTCSGRGIVFDDTLL